MPNNHYSPSFLLHICVNFVLAKFLNFNPLLWFAWKGNVELSLHASASRVVFVFALAFACSSLALRSLGLGLALGLGLGLAFGFIGKLLNRMQNVIGILANFVCLATFCCLRILECAVCQGKLEKFWCLICSC